MVQRLRPIARRRARGEPPAGRAGAREEPALAALGIRPGADRGALLAPLRAIAGEEYESFQLQARSLLGNGADGQVA